MKKYLLNCTISLFVLTSGFSLTSLSYNTNGNLTVLVKNIRNEKGQIGFCLYNSSSGFPKHPEKAKQCIFIKAEANSAVCTFTDIPLGNYAVCVFHDENNDHKINSNFIGIPTEGVGVSNNAKGHFGPPKFDDAKFDFTKFWAKPLLISLVYL